MPCKRGTSSLYVSISLPASTVDNMDVTYFWTIPSVPYVEETVGDSSDRCKKKHWQSVLRKSEWLGYWKWNRNWFLSSTTLLLIRFSHHKSHRTLSNRKTKGKKCNSRESNPGLIRGRDLSYHLTTIAPLFIPFIAYSPITIHFTHFHELCKPKTTLYREFTALFGNSDPWNGWIALTVNCSVC